jgi:hypothetical protein
MKQWLLTCILEDAPTEGEEHLSASDLRRCMVQNVLAGIAVKKLTVVPIPTRRVIEKQPKLPVKQAQNPAKTEI